MRVVKDAFIGTTKFSVAPDYVSVSGQDEVSGVGFSVQLSRSEAAEVVSWLNSELNRVLPEVIQVEPVLNEARTWAVPSYNPVKHIVAPVRPLEAVYEPGPRTATQTVEVKVGDPNLAYRASGGRTGMAGDGDTGVTDLGALAEKVGHV